MWKEKDDESPTIGAEGSTPAGRFYRVVWRWHFYAGLFAIPFMVMLAVTGSIYLFKPQLDRLMYRDLMFVAPGHTALPYTEQLAAAQAAFPEAKPKAFRPPDAPNRASEVDLTTSSERTYTLFVNPYDGRVLGRRDGDYNLQQVALLLHGELMIGKTGDYLIELASCWGLVLAITGLYLWWPRKGSSVWGTFLPRLRSSNPRTFWRDLHASAGLYGSGVIVFLILTGLPWTGFWGDTFASVWNQYPAGQFTNVPTSAKLTGVLNEGGEKTIPWAAEHLPMPKSDPGGTHAGHGGPTVGTQVEAIPSQDGVPPGTPVNIDSVVHLARSKGVPPGFEVRFPMEAEGVYTVSVAPDDPRTDAVLHIDQYTGRILMQATWAQYGWVPRVVELGIVLHEGRFFGLANQLLMLFASTALVVLCVTATVMWWKRRPIGRLGAPAMPRNLPLWKGAVALMAFMGVLFPLMGVSLVVVLLLDYLIISRMPRLMRVIN